MHILHLQQNQLGVVALLTWVIP